MLVELGRLNPQLEKLDVVIIGPELLENREWPYSGFLLPHEAPCHLKGKVRHEKALYHNCSAVVDGLIPDLCVAFNSGIDDPSHFDSWMPTLQFLNAKRAGVPFCITGFNHLEVVNATNKMKAMGFQEKEPPAANPFRSMRPFLDPVEEESKFVFGNTTYAILEGSG